MAELPRSWTLLVYRLPPMPTRLRIQVWRKLQAIGAVYLQDGVAALPSRDDLDENLSYVAQMVEEMGGSSLLLKANSFRPRDSEQLVERFRAVADARMREISERIDRTPVPEVVSFGALAKSEEELKRERLSYLKARRLNHCGSDLEKEVESKLA